MSLPLSPEIVANILRAQFPELACSTVVTLGEGCDHWTFLADDRWVFRFPKRLDAEQMLTTESALLSALALREPPAQLPEYRFQGRPSDETGRAFVGYEKLPGELAIYAVSSALDAGSIGAMLGEFLSWLHEFPVEGARSIGVRDQPMAAHLHACRAAALRSFSVVRAVAPKGPAAEWEKYLVNYELNDSYEPRPVLLHNDLAAEHILVNPTGTSITAVIDWSDVAIGDPAADFAGAYHWGGATLAGHAVSHYALSVDDGLHSRARFLAFCRGVADVEFGAESGRRENVEVGLRALSHCVEE